MSPIPDDPTCRDVMEVVADYLDDALAPDDRDRFDRHLAGCAGCRAALEQFRVAMSVTGRLGGDDTTDEQREAMRALFRGWRGAGSPQD
jgi:anti-sigma factor RsiW